MKLYYSPGASSLACHIVLQELGVNYDLIKVDLKHKLTQSQDNYWNINPKGSVPALELEDGTMLTECVAIMKYLADSKPELKLNYPEGDFKRYRMDEVLNYIATEIHLTYRPMVYANRLFPEGDSSTTLKNFVKEAVIKRIGYLDRVLDDQVFLFCDEFTIADAYFFTTLSWAKLSRMSFKDFKNIGDYFDRVKDMDSVRVAMDKEKGK